MPIQFNMNKQKAVEAVLWVIQNGISDMYTIWKILFAAEKYHINTYGCPITGGRYAALEYGTVPEWLYDLIKGGCQKTITLKQDNTLSAERTPTMDYLSQSDVEALKHGFDEYAGMDFDAIKKKNHEESAWKKNYVPGKRTPIPFEDIIEEDWLKEDLSYMASSMVL